jgi:hypothetical protein
MTNAMRPSLALLALTFLLAPCAFAARVVGVVEPVASIGSTLTLKVVGDPGPCAPLILFIQRSPIHGLVHRCGKGTVAFDLAVNVKNRERWHRILGGHWMRRNVTVGLGANDQFPFETLVGTEPFRIVRPWHMVLMIAIALLLLIAIVVVRRRTDTLDSLARIQIAVWLVVIALSYSYIWSITDETETITGSALALLGIGAGTAAGAAILKGTQRVDAKTVISTLANAPAADVTPVESSGPRGLHALQAGAWTFVLAIVFLGAVFRSLEMPEFSGQVLAMAGLSGGTYVAFSLPRRR